MTFGRRKHNESERVVTKQEQRERKAEYYDGVLESHLKDADCRKCGCKNDQPHELCGECQ